MGDSMGLRRNSLDVISKDPLRGNPPSPVLYGMETDSSLLTHPEFAARHESGRDQSRPFNREEQDPATLALVAAGAIRVPAEEIEACTWNEGTQRPDVARPLKSRPELFHAYELPPRRVADGSANHSWSYGTRLGPRVWALEQHGGGIETATSAAGPTQD